MKTIKIASVVVVLAIVGAWVTLKLFTEDIEDGTVGVRTQQ